ncbi:MAG TPA: c-type cytochrome [Terriglobales bacterium]|nr:c-type cytochrome [Terriglobales bacterium]
MKCQAALLAVLLFAIVACIACNSSPGRPSPDSEVIPPEQIIEFSVLYASNCAGCHGSNGNGGAAVSLGDPVFLAIADDAAIRRTAANGVPGTSMPAFAQSAGGMLTDKQIDAIVSGIRSWAKPDTLRGVNAPPYGVEHGGDPHKGADVFATYCSSCHGPDGKGGKKASSIVNGSYLALVSDQDLRTNVIVGRPEIGAPDWRNDVPNRPMSGQEISDVVAWLAAQRPQYPGQPYSKPPVERAAEGLP